MNKNSTFLFKLFEHLQTTENQQNEIFESESHIFTILNELNFEPSQKIVDFITNYSKLKHKKD